MIIVSLVGHIQTVQEMRGHPRDRIHGQVGGMIGVPMQKKQLHQQMMHIMAQI